MLPLFLALSTLPAPQTVDAINAKILDELATHRVVAIGETHGHQEFHELVVELLEDPQAAGVINDIVVEWGNSLYQDVVDRYVGGAAVPWDSVTMAWRNTVVSPNTVWDSPVYERFFREVRRINSELPPQDQYRVLLADSPVNWSEIREPGELSPYFDRAQAMADVLRNESVLLGRRSLFLSGGLHVSRLSRVRTNLLGVPWSEITPVAWIELRHPGITYAIQSVGRPEGNRPDASRTTGPTPRLIETVEDRSLGEIAANEWTTLRNRDGSKPNVYGASKLRDIVDAVIIWSDTQLTFEEPDPATYQIDWYWNELNRRSMMLRNEPMDSALKGS